MVDDRVWAEVKEALTVYHRYTAQAVTVSTLEQDDEITPELLAEIRSAFTHIAKAVCSEDATEANRLAQVQDARDHLVRAALDGFKIAIVRRLDKIKLIVESLQKYTYIDRDIMSEFSYCEGQRSICGRNENSLITGNPTIEDYADLYVRAYDLYQSLTERVPLEMHGNIKAMARLRAFYSSWLGLLSGLVFLVLGIAIPYAINVWLKDPATPVVQDIVPNTSETDHN